VIQRRLGEGGMATAYLASAPDGRQVVLKVPLEASAEMSIKLRDEAQAGFRIRHQHVVETIDFFLDTGRPVLVVDYVDGCCLRDLRQLGGKPNPLPPAAVAWLGRSIAEGLAAIHDATDEAGQPLRMLHRDVTPSNILIGRDGVPRLIDLGIARSAENQQEHTQVGMLKGTLRYVAPELLAGDHYSAATDLWSLGVCLFEAALGRHMVGGEPVAIFRAITSGTYRSLRPGEHIDPDLETAIFALVTDKDMRLRNARAAAAVFARLEQKLMAADPNHYAGQAWLQSWVPYAAENHTDNDSSNIESAAVSDDLVGVDADEVFASETDFERIKKGPTSAAEEAAASAPTLTRARPKVDSSPIAAAPASSSSASSWSSSPASSPSGPAPQATQKTIVGDQHYGYTPTIAMGAVDIPLPKASPSSSPSPSPSSLASDPAATLVLPAVDIVPPAATPSGPSTPSASWADPAATLLMPAVDLVPTKVEINVELNAKALQGAPGPTLVLPRVDIRPTTPTVQMPAAQLSGAPTTPRPQAPRLADAAPKSPHAINVSAPAVGDVLPAGADTIQMPTWTPPDADVKEPSSWDEEDRDRAVPKDATTSSTPAIRPPPAPIDGLLPVRAPPSSPPSAEAKPTLVMPAAAIPARPTSGEGAPVATVLMHAVDPLKPQP
jgi:serine/threonine-protein kinase